MLVKYIFCYIKIYMMNNIIIKHKEYSLDNYDYINIYIVGFFKYLSGFKRAKSF